MSTCRIVCKCVEELTTEASERINENGISNSAIRSLHKRYADICMAVDEIGSIFGLYALLSYVGMTECMTLLLFTIIRTDGGLILEVNCCANALNLDVQSLLAMLSRTIMIFFRYFVLHSAFFATI